MNIDEQFARKTLALGLITGNVPLVRNRYSYPPHYKIEDLHNLLKVHLEDRLTASPSSYPKPFESVLADGRKIAIYPALIDRHSRSLISVEHGQEATAHSGTFITDTMRSY